MIDVESLFKRQIFCEFLEFMLDSVREVHEEERQRYQHVEWPG